MKKVKFFAADTHERLQQVVNEWLKENKDISIIATDLEIAHKDTAAYLFYILYAGIDLEEKGKLQTLAVVDQSTASADPGKVVEVITNPEATIQN